MKKEHLQAPTRHPLNWEDPSFYDEEALDREMRRVFDVCHGCRRCFNLCDSFPRLFDLIDAAETAELDSVKSEGFQSVVDGCTLCDMCFMAKCPYVPPHEFNIDFPHLMLRHRAVQYQQGKTSRLRAQMTKTDRNGKWGTLFSGSANWISKRSNTLTRPLLEKAAGVDRRAELPSFSARTFLEQTKKAPPHFVNKKAPGYGKKAVLYATCFVNYNNPSIGQSARAVLGQNGVETEVVYPGCCAMPQLEQGNLPEVALKAGRTAKELLPWIDEGYTVIALIPSCALMLKQEWPLLLPQDASIQKLARHTRDLCEYLLCLEKEKGLTPGLKPLEGGISLHIACHARAQNMGKKAEELLRLIPKTPLNVIERCSGHGGAWGIFKDNFETALKVGRQAARQALKTQTPYVVSECPLAMTHLKQGIDHLPKTEEERHVIQFAHPIQLIAKAYGLLSREDVFDAQK